MASVFARKLFSKTAPAGRRHMSVGETPEETLKIMGKRMLFAFINISSLKLWLKLPHLVQLFKKDYVKFSTI